MGGLAISPEAGRVVVQEAGERPYGQAAEHLRREHGIRISPAFGGVEKLTQMMGEFWLERDDEQAEGGLRGKVIPLATCKQAPESCCVVADGTMVHAEGEWHEVRVGTVVSEEKGRKRKSSIARFADVGRFGADLWRKACQHGYRQASRRAFLSDGSHWIRAIAELHFPDAVQTLDWYHLSEHLSKCANEVFGEGTEESRQWAAQMRQTMKEGNVNEGLEEVDKLLVRSEHKRQAKRELITYLTNNRDRVDYPRYRGLGLTIGSGQVEADCKVVVQARCKQSGMRWSKRGAEQVLRVRCALRDASFSTLWDSTRQSMTLWHKRRLRQQPREAA